MADYKNKLQKLKNRRFDSATHLFSLNESFNKNQYGDSTTYAFEAMEAIKAEYTQNTYFACERVKNQLQAGLKEYGINVEFRFQGSVPTNTHIKLHSDIDLLTIHNSFITLEQPQKPLFPYEGNPIDDLQNLRNKTFRILDTVYSACSIDNTGSKAITISGGSLNRKIDIIASNWYDSNNYTSTQNEVLRGVNILDSKKGVRIVNFPFIHINLINSKDDNVNGNEKRLIRLLKTLKIDADNEVKISSYDIASLVYRMDDNILLCNSWEKLKLLINCNLYLIKVINDTNFRNELFVVNGTRKIFSDDGAKVEEVVKLQKELQDLIQEISKEIHPIYSNIQNASIFY